MKTDFHIKRMLTLIVVSLLLWACSSTSPPATSAEEAGPLQDITIKMTDMMVPVDHLRKEGPDGILVTPGYGGSGPELYCGKPYTGWSYGAMPNRSDRDHLPYCEKEEEAEMYAAREWGEPHFNYGVIWFTKYKDGVEVKGAAWKLENGNQSSTFRGNALYDAQGNPL